MTTQYEDPGYLEAVYAALFARLSSAVFADGSKFVTTSRVLDVPDQVSAANQPALVLAPGPLHAEQREAFSLTKWTITAIAAVYFQADGSLNPNPLPATQAANYVWGLQAVLLSTQPPYQKQTLGGLVYHAWIEGEVMMNVTEQQVVIVVPIFILPGPVN